MYILASDFFEKDDEYDRVLDKPGHYRTFFSDTNESGFPWA